MTQPIQTSFTPDPTASDMEHLRILSICFYVKAALELALACFYLMFVVIGGGFFGALAKGTDNAAPLAFLFLLIPFLVMFCLIIPFSILDFFAARSLKRARRPTLCTIAAVLACLAFPVGTVLGVFTFVVMTRPSVKALFAKPK